jgi:1-aminocyclopropane-1-carboxylate deaminase/D-cysteine desulfhydrase-like pyridoxal-dependent ACC family enzyme
VTTTLARVLDADTLTPVERYTPCWFKRDDLFMPFDDIPLSGGKVRQALKLLGNNRQHIIEQEGGVVLTATGVHSPQGLIIARAAQEHGLRCVVFVGATDGNTVRRHHMLRSVIATGATLNTSARVAYEGALATAMHNWRTAHHGGYIVKFGINLEQDRAAVLDSTSNQARNIPAEIETVVISVGSGITAAGILLGLAEHAAQVRRVVLIQIAGYDRRDTINRIAGACRYEWHSSKRWTYSTLVRCTVAPGFVLDPIYEAKAFLLQRALGITGDNVCHWVIGDSTRVRRLA